MKFALKSRFSQLIFASYYYLWNRFITKDIRKTLLGLWYFTNGNQKLLIDIHQLNSNSVVFDIGGYFGVFSDQIIAKYNPTIYIFEPISEYAKVLMSKYFDNNKVKVIEKGVWTETTTKDIQITGESSSLDVFDNRKTGVKLEQIKLMSISEILTKYSINRIDLCSMNIEGSEYDLLDYMLERGLFKNINTLQVQFHQNVKDFEIRRAEILTGLSKIYETVYSYPYVWECFRKIG